MWRPKPVAMNKHWEWILNTWSPPSMYQSLTVTSLTVHGLTKMDRAPVISSRFNVKRMGMVQICVLASDFLLLLPSSPLKYILDNIFYIIYRGRFWSWSGGCCSSSLRHQSHCHRHHQHHYWRSVLYQEEIQGLYIYLLLQQSCMIYVWCITIAIPVQTLYYYWILAVLRCIIFIVLVSMWSCSYVPTIQWKYHTQYEVFTYFLSGSQSINPNSGTCQVTFADIY